jgi:hypothetical protein
MTSASAKSAAAAAAAAACVVITGASSTYYFRLRNLIGSIKLQDAGRAIIVYDLGLTQNQVSQIKSWNLTLHSFADVAPANPHGRSGEGWSNSSYAFKPQVFTMHQTQFLVR